MTLACRHTYDLQGGRAMSRRLSTESLARASSRHPRRTVTVWLLVLVSAGLAVSSLLGGNLSTDFDFTNDPESKRAEKLLEELAPPELTELVVVRSETTGV